MLAQFILYNQFSERYIQPGVTHVFFVITTDPIVGPREKVLDFHPASLVLTYAAGKNFLAELETRGITTQCIIARNFQSGIETFVQKTGITQILSMESSEAYIRAKIEKIKAKLLPKKIEMTLFPNREFLFTLGEIQSKFPKPPLMEYFYRFARKKTGVLMEDDAPLGGKWNFDHENRRFDRHHTPTSSWKNPGSVFLREAQTYYGYTENFLFPTTRAEALDLLEYFVEHHLPNFGRLEDAMYQKDDIVHHSLLSGALNIGLISPKEILEKVEKSIAPIESKEGYIRQILGWREYIRYFFETYQSDIHEVNHLSHTPPLPLYFWGQRYQDTLPESIGSMQCISTVIDRVDRLGYSHHIERLMIIGNFTLLAGIDPHSVNHWFWEQYTDAFEWVVTPNVIAMSQFADGGRLASKPYVSSANYINSMSDFCKNCRYDPKEKYGETACPMNGLYWNFVDDRQDIFKKGRQPFILNQLPKIDLEALQKQKTKFLQSSHII